MQRTGYSCLDPWWDSSSSGDSGHPIYTSAWWWSWISPAEYHSAASMTVVLSHNYQIQEAYQNLQRTQNNVMWGRLPRWHCALWEALWKWRKHQKQCQSWASARNWRRGQSWQTPACTSPSLDIEHIPAACCHNSELFLCSRSMKQENPEARRDSPDTPAHIVLLLLQRQQATVAVTPHPTHEPHLSLLPILGLQACAQKAPECPVCKPPW